MSIRSPTAQQACDSLPLASDLWLNPEQRYTTNDEASIETKQLALV